MNLETLLNFVSGHLNLFGIGIFVFFAYWQISTQNKSHKLAKRKLEQAIKTKMNEPPTLHPEIDPNLCAGCGACTNVCPEGDILKLVNHKAVLVSPTKCVGHGECERACPFNAISLVFGTKTRGMEIPRVTTNYETNVPGLYIAGELGGMGLIRNAIKQGVAAAEHAIKNISPSSEGTDTDVIIVGAGPAGLAASLVAISRQKKYVCIEQNTFGGTVANFPRQKIVMSQPSELPLVGTMSFPNSKVSKEQLLEYWNQVRRRAKVEIQEGTKFDTLEKKGNVFHVKTSRGDFTAKKVILAIGVRGSPRRLGLPNEDLPKVTYNLVDPEQYQKKNISVVGGGNAATEVAQLLARSPYGNKVTLIVRGEALSCNEENQKKTLAMAQKKLIQIQFNSNVKEINPHNILIQTKDKTAEIPNDFLFIFAGTEMPFQFLMSLGIKIDKKFGEAIKKV